MRYGGEVTVHLPMREIRDYANKPEVLRALVDERFRVARLALQDLVLRNTGVDIGDGSARPFGRLP